jgi:hypothetical protein
MKEQNKDIIQYHPAKERPISGLGGGTTSHGSKVSLIDPMVAVNLQKCIPRDEIEQCISDDYKDIISRMRGQRKDNAFSNYSRFTPQTKFEIEAIDERNKSNFSVIDTNKKLLKKIPNYPHFL